MLHNCNAAVRQLTCLPENCKVKGSITAKCGFFILHSFQTFLHIKRSVLDRVPLGGRRWKDETIELQSSSLLPGVKRAFISTEWVVKHFYGPKSNKHFVAS